MVFIWACCKLKDKEAQRKHEDKQRVQEHEEKMKRLELKEMVLNKPDEIVREFLKQICDKTNPNEVRIAIINALPELRRGLTPINATDIAVNGAPSMPSTTQTEPENVSSEPEISTQVQTCGVTNNGRDVAVEMEMGQMKKIDKSRIQSDEGNALAGPPPPPLPPPTYQQSVNHPMVIITEQESPEVLEALQAFISGFSGAVEERNKEGNDLGHTIK